MQKLIALVLAMVMVAAACGGGTDLLEGSDGVAAGDTSDDSSSDDSSGDDGSGDDGTSDDGSSDDSGDVSLGQFGGDFCALAAEREAQETAFDTVNFFDPVALEAAFNENRELLDEAVAIAPDEIRADLELIQQDFNQVYELFAQNDFDATIVSELPDQSAFDDDPAVDAAGERVDAYVLEVCGIDPDANEDDDTTGPAGDNTQLVIDALVAFGFSTEESTCLAEAISIDEFTALSEGDVPDEILQRFVDCGVSLEELAEIGAGGAPGGGDDSGSTDDGSQPVPDSALDAIVQTLIASGFTEAEAECLAGELITLPDGADLQAALVPALATCGIPLERLSELGG